MREWICFATVLVTLLSFQIIHAAGKEDITPEERQLLEEARQQGASEDQIKELKYIFQVRREEDKIWTEQELDELDTVIRSKWDRMREALDRGDIDRAVSFFCLKKRKGYRDLFSHFPQKTRSKIARGLSDIQRIKVYGGHYAEYDIRHVTDGKTYSYIFKFLRNSDGEWEIESF
ncbi:MAG: hypothetical protein JXB42_11825 [Deltaproteobacteria bacterium]|nr:hypothetical protein [Deltaproteobacteria bacterium]